MGYKIKTVKDFRGELGIKPRMYLVEISIFKLNYDILRPTKIMNRAKKIGHIFRKQSTLRIKVFSKISLIQFEFLVSDSTQKKIGQDFFNLINF